MYIDIFITMKKEQLTNIIREAVREELKSFLPKLIKEINLKEEADQQSNSDIVEVTKKSLSKVRTKKPNEMKSYSKNPAINQILNETKGGIPQEGGLVSNNPNVVKEFQGQSVEVESLPDHLSNALTRNYSDVMKLVDKKKGKIT